ncbi:MAG: hypothetical protein Q9167_006692 [Letrouitia subvulpina]
MIKINALGEALSIKPGQECLDSTAFVRGKHILQLCGSLVRKSIHEDFIESAHFTVREFLLSLSEDSDSSLRCYSLQVADEKYFAITALNYLCCEDFASEKLARETAATKVREGRYPRHPFREIASSSALEWASQHLDSTEVFLVHHMREDDNCCFLTRFLNTTEHWQHSRNQNLHRKAIKHGNARLLEDMIKAEVLDVDWIDDDTGKSALHLAVQENRLEIARCLLDHGFPCNLKSSRGETPLHMAAASASEDLILFLLSQGADTQALDHRMYTVWHFAVERNDCDTLMILQGTPVCHGALPTVNQKNESGESALILALILAMVGQPYEKVELLLEAGADTAVKDKKGWAPIHHAVSRGLLLTVQLFSRDLVCWRDRCIARLFESEYPDMLIIHLAALYGHVDCLRFILEFSSHFDIEDKALDWSLLMFAVISHDSSTVVYLLQRGARCTASSTGTTPLHIAVESRQPHMVNLLLQHGHDAHATDCEGVTPMMIAWRNRDPSIVSALNERDAQQG